MGLETTLQAIPESCELLVQARADQRVAELTQFINYHAINGFRRSGMTPAEIIYNHALEELDREHPKTIQRYFYGGGRNWDMILYLLSEERRDPNARKDDSMIYKAIRGCERLHPEAKAGQGVPIGFVSAFDAVQITKYLEAITLEQFRQHYLPPKMYEEGVYKMYPDAAEELFNYIWEEFKGIREFYREVAVYEEAVIACLD